MHYVDVNPGVPVSVGKDIVAYDQPQAVGISIGSDIKWPQAPPMVDSLGDVFRTPSWFYTMATMVDKGRHIALAGPPGVGKDTAVQELAAMEGRILVTVGGDAGFRRRDLVGNLQISNGRSFLEVAEYAAAVVNGWWALVTEVNAADADALLFINAQLAPPYIINIGGKAYPVHPDFRLFVTYNPGLIGTKPLPQAFKDRFFSIQVPFFSEFELKKILVSHGAPEDAEWTNDIVKFGSALWKAQERGQIRYQVTSRRLMDAVELMKSDIVTSTLEAINLAVIAAIDSPVEAGTAKQILNNI
jgi:MoxR-like ATPase